MELLDLAYFKWYCKADDYQDDDEKFDLLLATARQHIVNMTARTEDELCSMGGGSLPLPIQQAIVLYGKQLYDQPDNVAASAMNAVPYGLEALIKPYRKLSDREG